MMMGSNLRIDETSCGQVVCQHPACWYSNRRVERGLPRTQYVEPEDNGNISDEELPTLKVLNMLGEYGYDPGDRYPTQHPLPRKRLPKPSSLMMMMREESFCPCYSSADRSTSAECT
nr:uncharacterized protein C9orf43-like [Lytechinus pictus]